jgi:rhodanese-related sulfurtransferase
MGDKTVMQLVAQAKAQIDNLGPDQVEAELRHGAVLVDVREAEERAQAAIAGSIHIPRGLLEFKADPASPAHPAVLDPHHRVILHCASGGRSALSGAALKQLGYTNVAHLDGGMKAWIAAGKPVVRGA